MVIAGPWMHSLEQLYKKNHFTFSLHQMIHHTNENTSEGVLLTKIVNTVPYAIVKWK